MDNGASSYRRYLDGDDNGFAQIVDTYYDGLTLYLNSYVRNLDIAEDLAEETLAKLIIKKPKFRGRSSFKTWLYSIGRNLAVDYMRRHSNDSVSIDDCLNLASDEEVEQNYLHEDSKVMMYRAMARLKTEYRQVLWLYYFEDLDQKEIAQVMKKSLDSVKHLVSRARLSLKSELEKEDFTL